MKKQINKKYINYITKTLQELLSIDSPSGYTQNVTDYVVKELKKMDYAPYKTIKGCVVAELGGESSPLVLTAHVDTLGGMIREIKDNGHIKITPIGGLEANNIETENCRIITYDDKVYGASAQLENASIHVNKEYKSTERSFDKVEVLLDEIVKDKKAVAKLGIEVGNYVCFDPRTVIASSGIIKSRFLDDKYSAAILLGLAKVIADEKIELSRKVYLFFSVYEEVGHGASSGIPADAVEVVSVDMGCVGDSLECSETQVSICSKDSRGPYDYNVTKKLVKSAKKAEVDYAVDVYPMYGSDADAALGAGYDVMHGLIGPGVYASHGYERSSVQAGKNTLALLLEYINN